MSNKKVVDKKNEPSTLWLVLPVPLAIIIFFGGSIFNLIWSNSELSVATKLIISFIKFGVPLILMISWMIYLVYYCVSKSQK